MEFIDRTGHIFSLQHYSSYPTGYEYTEHEYTFWLSDEYSSQLSVNCFYIRPIRFITSNEITNIEITLKETNNFKLLSPNKINEAISKNQNIFDYVELNYISDKASEYIKNGSNSIKPDIPKESDFKMTLELSELDIIKNIYVEKYFYINNANKEIEILDESEIKTINEIFNNNLDLLNLTEQYRTNDYYKRLKVEGKLLVIRENIDDFDKFYNDTNALLTKEIYGEQNFVYDIIDKEINSTHKVNESGNVVHVNRYDNEVDCHLSRIHELLNYKLGDLGLIEDNAKYIRVGNEWKLVGSKPTKYSIVTFYVIGTSSEPGTWSTNVLIKLNSDGYNSYCPITVGGSFVDETEELVINAKNMGINLPKDICRALYNSSFWNETPDLSLWNQKIKEYLLNYMKLYGERGNFQSASNALKWFGYSDRIKLSSLIQTDNQYVEQYILNNFDIQFDVINEFRYFRNSTLLSLEIQGNVATNETWPMDFEKDFWGEGKPKIENLFEKTETVKHDDIEFIKPHYDYLFNEIGLKLSALKYYYQKYFLPIHLYIHRSSITNQVFAPDIKLISSARTLITEKIVTTYNTSTTVEFPVSKKIWLSEQCRLVDENWLEDIQLQSYLNKHDLIEKTDTLFFDIVDNCFCVTIKFINRHFENKPEQVFNCRMYAYQDDDLMKESYFSFSSDKETYILNFIIYPKLLNPNFDINFWLDRKYKIELLCNGEWYNYEFEIGVPELDIEVGKLQYKYESDLHKQFSKFEGNKPIFNIAMYTPELVTINNIDFVNELCDSMQNEYYYPIDNNFIQENILGNDIYYYYFDHETGNKTILSSGKWTLEKENGKFVIKKNKYILKDKDGNYKPNEIIELQKENGMIYSSQYRNIHSYVNLYSLQQDIPLNYKFLNKVHIFDLFERDEDGNNHKVKYDPSKHGKTKYFKEVNGDYVRKYWKENSFYDSSNKLLSTPPAAGDDESTYYISLLSGVFSNLDEETQTLKYENLVFSDNDSVYVKDLYNAFFDTSNGKWNKTLKYWDDNNKENPWIATSEERRLFDIYIMHDFSYWYAVMISKSTIGDSNYNLNNIHKYYISGEEWGKKYTLELNRSDNKFLINRMQYMTMRGCYHFHPEDMIVAKLNNFNSLPYKLKIGTRWNFYPLGIGSTIKDSFESPTNIGLMSVKPEDISHSKGYYAVQVNYSIDNFQNDSQERKTRILISNEIASPQGIYVETPTIKEVPNIRVYIDSSDKSVTTDITDLWKKFVSDNSFVFDQIFDDENNKQVIRFVVQNSKTSFNVNYKRNFESDSEWDFVNKTYNSTNFYFSWYNNGSWTLDRKDLYNEEFNEFYGYEEYRKFKFKICENDKVYESEEYNLNFKQTSINNIYERDVLDWTGNIEETVHDAGTIKNTDGVGGNYIHILRNYYKPDKPLRYRVALDNAGKKLSEWLYGEPKILVRYGGEEHCADNHIVVNVIGESQSMRLIAYEKNVLEEIPLFAADNYDAVTLSYKTWDKMSGFRAFARSKNTLNNEATLTFTNPLNRYGKFILVLTKTKYNSENKSKTNIKTSISSNDIMTICRDGSERPLFNESEFIMNDEINCIPITPQFVLDDTNDGLDYFKYSTNGHKWNDWENLSDEPDQIIKKLKIKYVETDTTTNTSTDRYVTINIKQDKKLL